MESNVIRAGRPIEILLVEDSPTDAMMTREAFELSKVLNQLNVVEDGVEAVAYLNRTGKYSECARPDVILLDLNLPRKNGLEVLSEIKSSDALKTIPVVVLTTSKADEDIVKSYGRHANCYITKPVDFSKLVDVVGSIREFWFTVVTLPPEVS
jgi:CheY-like chemotaxis protein